MSIREEEKKEIQKDESLARRPKVKRNKKIQARRRSKQEEAMKIQVQ